MNMRNAPWRLVGIMLLISAVLLLFGAAGLLVPFWLIGLGLFMWRRQRRLGRVVQGVHIGVWGIGLALSLLLHLDWIIALLLLAGSSFLLRGREHTFDGMAQTLWLKIANPVRRVSRNAVTPSQVISIEPNAPATGETRKL